MVHTIESMRALLHRNPVSMKTGRTMVESSIVALYQRQTASEKATGNTHVSNGIGFSAFDAPQASYMARWILDGKHLTGRYSVRALTMTCKYAGQLVEMANEAEAMKVARESLAALNVEVRPDQIDAAKEEMNRSKFRNALGM